MTGKFLMTSSHVPAVKIELGFVRESILHGVVIKVLVDFITPVMTATLGLAFHRPHPFHPATFIDVVNEKIAKRTTA
jgi:hypothetical protein